MSIARSYLFETFYYLQLKSLIESTDQRIAEIAAKAEKEIHYHVRHARQWLVRLGDGTEESHARMQTAIDELWRFTGEMFSADELDQKMADLGVAPALAGLRETVADALEEATLSMPEDQWMASGGKQGTHSEHMGYLLAELQFLQRSHPGATW